MRDVKPYMEFLPAGEWSESDLESRSVEVVEVMLAPLPPLAPLLPKPPLPPVMITIFPANPAIPTENNTSLSAKRNR